jgi:hypothetical protein
MDLPGRLGSIFVYTAAFIIGAAIDKAIFPHPGLSEPLSGVAAMVVVAIIWGLRRPAHA